MEETLKLIIDKLDRLEEGQKSLFEGQKNLEEGQKSLFEGQKNLELRQGSLEESQKSLIEGQKGLELRQINLEEEQKEMRKELGFYYGSMMKKLDEVKTELKSDFNHIASTQRQHQDVLELLNKKQKQ
jgi:hypothetical protein